MSEFLRAWRDRDASALAACTADDCVCASIHGAVWADGAAATRSLVASRPTPETDEGELAALGAVVVARIPSIDPASAAPAKTLGVFTIREGRVARIDAGDAEDARSDDDASRSIATRQLAAYNAQQLDAHCDCFAREVIVSDFLGPASLSGIDAYRARYSAMFAQHPQNHAELVARVVAGAMVVDHERVRRTPTSDPFEVLAIYTIREGLIARVRFVR